ncbi:uncharacterized protein LOC126285200 [Schistocerca gregaria]|uniref:uncharacterized protein LOC126285200 n=1 Tax=Schistocerca gregaria TaxID=7010 RepID=UPI00211DA893|nr:uncharacterized protein LOC126285200 [Schistocerca gregaria]
MSEKQVLTGVAAAAETKEDIDDYLKTTLSEEQYKTLMEIVDSNGEEVEIEATDMSKEDRRKLHTAIVKCGKSRLISNTVDKDGKKYIVVKRSSKAGKQERRSVPWPADRGGEYVYFILHKENMDTMETVNLIASRLRVKPNLITYAGMKDRRAKTSQLMCVWKVEPQRLVNVSRSLRGIEMGNYSFHQRPLRLGDLRGNRFRIVLRNVTGSDKQIEDGLTSLKTKGFLNYYGLQRFGSSLAVPTHEIGKALLLGNWQKAVELILKPRDGEPLRFLAEARKVWWETRDPAKAIKILRNKDKMIEGKLLLGLSRHGPKNYLNALDNIPRGTRLMYLHSYQSLIWNKVVSRRMQKFGLQPIAGDLVLQGEERAEPVELLEVGDHDATANQQTSDTADDNASNRQKPSVRILSESDVKDFTIYDIVLPLPGHDVVYPQNETKEWFEELLQADGLSPAKLKQSVRAYSVGGAYRHIAVRPTNVSWKIMHYSDPQTTLVLSDLEEMQKVTPPEDEKDGVYKALILDFCLPSSTYATMAVREVLKSDTSCYSQALLNDYHVPTGPNGTPKRRLSSAENGDSASSSVSEDVKTEPQDQVTSTKHQVSSICTRATKREKKTTDSGEKSDSYSEDGAPNKKKLKTEQSLSAFHSTNIKIDVTPIPERRTRRSSRLVASDSEKDPSAVKNVMDTKSQSTGGGSKQRHVDKVLETSFQSAVDSKQCDLKVDRSTERTSVEVVPQNNKLNAPLQAHVTSLSVGLEAETVKKKLETEETNIEVGCDSDIIDSEGHESSRKKLKVSVTNDSEVNTQHDSGSEGSINTAVQAGKVECSVSSVVRTENSSGAPSEQMYVESNITNTQVKTSITNTQISKEMHPCTQDCNVMLQEKTVSSVLSSKLNGSETTDLKSTVGTVENVVCSSSEKTEILASIGCSHETDKSCVTSSVLMETDTARESHKTDRLQIQSDISKIHPEDGNESTKCELSCRESSTCNEETENVKKTTVECAEALVSPFRHSEGSETSHLSETEVKQNLKQSSGNTDASVPLTDGGSEILKHSALDTVDQPDRQTESETETQISSVSEIKTDVETVAVLSPVENPHVTEIGSQDASGSAVSSTVLSSDCKEDEKPSQKKLGHTGIVLTATEEASHSSSYELCSEDCATSHSGFKHKNINKDSSELHSAPDCEDNGNGSLKEHAENFVESSNLSSLDQVSLESTKEEGSVEVDMKYRDGKRALCKSDVALHDSAVGNQNMEEEKHEKEQNSTDSSVNYFVDTSCKVGTESPQPKGNSLNQKILKPEEESKTSISPGADSMPSLSEAKLVSEQEVSMVSDEHNSCTRKLERNELDKKSATSEVQEEIKTVLTDLVTDAVENEMEIINDDDISGKSTSDISSNLHNKNEKSQEESVQPEQNMQMKSKSSQLKVNDPIKETVVKQNWDKEECKKEVHEPPSQTEMDVEVVAPVQQDIGGEMESVDAVTVKSCPEKYEMHISSKDKLKDLVVDDCCMGNMVQSVAEDSDSCREVPLSENKESRLDKTTLKTKAQTSVTETGKSNVSEENCTEQQSNSSGKVSQKSVFALKAPEDNVLCSDHKLHQESDNAKGMSDTVSQTAQKEQNQQTEAEKQITATETKLVLMAGGSKIFDTLPKGFDGKCGDKITFKLIGLKHKLNEDETTYEKLSPIANTEELVPVEDSISTAHHSKPVPSTVTGKHCEESNIAQNAAIPSKDETVEYLVMGKDLVIHIARKTDEEHDHIFALGCGSEIRKIVPDVAGVHMKAENVNCNTTQEKLCQESSTVVIKCNEKLQLNVPDAEPEQTGSIAIEKEPIEGSDSNKEQMEAAEPKEQQVEASAAEEEQVEASAAEEGQVAAAAAAEEGQVAAAAAAEEGQVAAAAAAEGAQVAAAAAAEGGQVEAAASVVEQLEAAASVVEQLEAAAGEGEQMDASARKEERVGLVVPEEQQLDAAAAEGEQVDVGASEVGKTESLDSGLEQTEAVGVKEGQMKAVETGSAPADPVKTLAMESEQNLAMVLERSESEALTKASKQTIPDQTLSVAEKRIGTVPANAETDQSESAADDQEKMDEVAKEQGEMEVLCEDLEKTMAVDERPEKTQTVAEKLENVLGTAEEMEQTATAAEEPKLSKTAVGQAERRELEKKEPSVEELVQQGVSGELEAAEKPQKMEVMSSECKHIAPLTEERVQMMPVAEEFEQMEASTLEHLQMEATVAKQKQTGTVGKKQEEIWAMAAMSDETETVEMKPEKNIAATASSVELKKSGTVKQEKIEIAAAKPEGADTLLATAEQYHGETEIAVSESDHAGVLTAALEPDQAKAAASAQEPDLNEAAAATTKTISDPHPTEALAVPAPEPSPVEVMDIATTAPAPDQTEVAAAAVPEPDQTEAAAAAAPKPDQPAVATAGALEPDLDEVAAASAAAPEPDLTEVVAEAAQEPDPTGVAAEVAQELDPTGVAAEAAQGPDSTGVAAKAAQGPNPTEVVAEAATAAAAWEPDTAEAPAESPPEPDPNASMAATPIPDATAMAAAAAPDPDLAKTAAGLQPDQTEAMELAFKVNGDEELHGMKEAETVVDSGFVEAAVPVESDQTEAMASHVVLDHREGMLADEERDQTEAVSSAVEPEQTEAVSSAVEPEQTEAVSSAVEPEQTEAVSSAVEPEQTEALSSAVEPEQTEALSSAVEPEQTEALSSAVEPEQTEAVSSAVESEQTEAVSSAVESEQTEAVSSAVEPEQTEALSSAVEPEQSEAVSPAVEPEQSEAVSPAVEPEQSEAVSPAVEPEQSEAVSPAVEPEQSEAVSPAVEPEQSEAVSPAVEPEQSEAVSPAVEPEQSEAVSPAVEPEQTEAVSPAVEPEQSEAVSPAVEPEQTEAVSPAVEPEQTEALSSAVEPEQTEALSSAVEPEQTEALSSAVEPEQTEALSSAVEPEQTEALSSAVEPEQTEALSSAVEPEQTEAVSSAVESEQTEAVSSAVESEQTEAVSSAVESEQTEAVSSAVEPEQTEALSSAVEPEQSEAVSPAVEPEQSEAVSPAVEPEQSEAVSPAVEPEQSEAVSPAVEPEQSEAVSPAVEPEQSEAVSPAVEPEQSEAVSPAVEPEQSEAVSPAVEPEQSEAVSPAVEPEQSEAVSPAVEPEQSEAVSPAVEPEQSEAVSPAVEPEQSEAVSPAVEPEQSEAVSPAVEPEQTEAVSPAVEPEQTEGVSPAVEPEQTEAVSPAVEPEQTEAVSPAVEPEQTEAVSPAVEPEQTEAVSLAVEPEQTEAVSLAVEPEQTEGVSPAVEPEQTEAVSPAVAPEQTEAVSPAVAPEQTEAVSPAVEPEQTEAVSPAVEPEQTEAVSLAVEPEQTEAVSPAVEPEQTEAVSPAVEPEQTEAVSSAVEPEQTEADRAAMELDQTEADRAAMELDQTESVEAAVELDQTETVSATVEPYHTETVSATVEPYHTERMEIIEESDKTEVAGAAAVQVETEAVGAAAEQAQTEAVGAVAEQAQTEAVGAAAEQAQTEAVGAAAEQAQTEAVGAAAEQAQTEAVGAAAEQAQTEAVGAAAEQAQTEAVGAAAEQAQTEAVGAAAEQAQTEAVGAAAEQAQTEAVGAAAEQAQTEAVGAAAEQAQTEAVGAAAEQAQTEAVGAAAEQAQTEAVGAAAEQAQTEAVGAAAEQAQTEAVGAAAEQAQTEAVGAAAEQAQTEAVGAAAEQDPTKSVGAAAQTHQPEAVSVTVVPYHTEGMETEAVAAAVEPAQSEPVGAAVEPPQTEPVGAAVEPPQTEPVGAAVEPPQTEPVGAAVEPPQTEAVGAAVEPPQTEAVGAAVEPPQTEAVGAAVEPPQTEAVGAAVEPAQTEAVGAAVEPAQTEAVGAAVEPAQTEAVGAAVEPAQTEAVGAAVEPAQTEAVGAAVEPAQTEAVGAAVEPAQTEAVGAAVEPAQTEAVGAAVEPAQTEAVGAAVEPAQTEAVGAAVEPAQTEAVGAAVEPAQTEAVGAAVEPAQTEAVGAAVEPAQTEAVGAAVEPAQTEAVGAAVEPAQTEAVGAAVEPAQTEAVGAAVEPAQTEAVGAAVEPAQTEAVGAAVEPPQSEAVGAAVEPPQSEAVGAAVESDVNDSLSAAVVPDQTEALPVVTEPDQNEAVGAAVEADQTENAGAPSTLVQTEEAGAPAEADQTEEAGAPAEADQTEEAGAPAEADQTEEAGAPAEADQTEEAGAPAEADQTEEAGAPAEADQTEEAGAPAEADQTEEAGAPAEADQTEEAGAPAEADQTEEAGAPAEADQTEEAGAPAEADQTEEAGAPAEADQTEEAGAPAEADQTEEAGAPAEADQTEEAGAPAEADQTEEAGAPAEADQTEEAGAPAEADQTEAAGTAAEPDQNEGTEAPAEPAEKEAIQTPAELNQSEAAGTTAQFVRSEVVGAADPDLIQALGVVPRSTVAVANAGLTEAEMAMTDPRQTKEVAKLVVTDLSVEIDLSEKIEAAAEPGEVEANHIGTAVASGHANVPLESNQTETVVGIHVMEKVVSGAELVEAETEHSVALMAAGQTTLVLKPCQSETSKLIEVTEIGAASCEPEQAEASAAEPEQAEASAAEPEQAEASAAEPEQAEASAAEPEQAEASAAEPEQAEASAAEPEQAEASAAEPEQAEASAAEPEQAEASGAEPEQAEASGAEPEQAEASGAEPEQAEASGAEPEQAEASGAEPEQAEASGAEPEQAEASGAEPEQAEASGAEPEQAEASAAEPEKAEAPAVSRSEETEASPAASELGSTEVVAVSDKSGTTVEADQSRAPVVTARPSETEALVDSTGPGETGTPVDTAGAVKIVAPPAAQPDESESPTALADSDKCEPPVATGESNQSDDLAVAAQPDKSEAAATEQSDTPKSFEGVDKFKLCNQVGSSDELSSLTERSSQADQQLPPLTDSDQIKATESSIKPEISKEGSSTDKAETGDTGLVYHSSSSLKRKAVSSGSDADNLKDYVKPCKLVKSSDVPDTTSSKMEKSYSSQEVGEDVKISNINVEECELVEKKESDISSTAVSTLCMEETLSSVDTECEESSSLGMGATETEQLSKSLADTLCNKMADTDKEVCNSPCNIDLKKETAEATEHTLPSVANSLSLVRDSASKNIGHYVSSAREEVNTSCVTEEISDVDQTLKATKVENEVFPRSEESNEISVHHERCHTEQSSSVTPELNSEILERSLEENVLKNKVGGDLLSLKKADTLVDLESQPVCAAESETTNSVQPLTCKSQEKCQSQITPNVDICATVQIAGNKNSFSDITDGQMEIESKPGGETPEPSASEIEEKDEPSSEVTTETAVVLPLHPTLHSEEIVPMDVDKNVQSVTPSEYGIISKSSLTEKSALDIEVAVVKIEDAVQCEPNTTNVVPQASSTVSARQEQLHAATDAAADLSASAETKLGLARELSDDMGKKEVSSKFVDVFPQSVQNTTVLPSEKTLSISNTSAELITSSKVPLCVEPILTSEALMSRAVTSTKDEVPDQQNVTRISPLTASATIIGEGKFPKDTVAVPLPSDDVEMSKPNINPVDNSSDGSPCNIRKTLQHETETSSARVCLQIDSSKHVSSSDRMDTNLETVHVVLSTSEVAPMSPVMTVASSKTEEIKALEELKGQGVVPHEETTAKIAASSAITESKGTLPAEDHWRKKELLGDKKPAVSSDKPENEKTECKNILMATSVSVKATLSPSESDEVCEETSQVAIEDTIISDGAVSTPNAKADSEVGHENVEQVKRTGEIVLEKGNKVGSESLPKMGVHQTHSRPEPLTQPESALSVASNVTKNLKNAKAEVEELQMPEVAFCSDKLSGASVVGTDKMPSSINTHTSKAAELSKETTNETGTAMLDLKELAHSQADETLVAERTFVSDDEAKVKSGEPKLCTVTENNLTTSQTVTETLEVVKSSETAQSMKALTKSSNKSTVVSSHSEAETSVVDAKSKVVTSTVEIVSEKLESMVPPLNQFTGEQVAMASEGTEREMKTTGLQTPRGTTEVPGVPGLDITPPAVLSSQISQNMMLKLEKEQKETETPVSETEILQQVDRCLETKEPSNKEMPLGRTSLTADVQEIEAPHTPAVKSEESVAHASDQLSEQQHCGGKRKLSQERSSEQAAKSEVTKQTVTDVPSVLGCEIPAKMIECVQKSSNKVQGQNAQKTLIAPELASSSVHESSEIVKDSVTQLDSSCAMPEEVETAFTSESETSTRSKLVASIEMEEERQMIVVQINKSGEVEQSLKGNDTQSVKVSCVESEKRLASQQAILEKTEKSLQSSEVPTSTGLISEELFVRKTADDTSELCGKASVNQGSVSVSVTPRSSDETSLFEKVATKEIGSDGISASQNSLTAKNKASVDCSTSEFVPDKTNSETAETETAGEILLHSRDLTKTSEHHFMKEKTNEETVELRAASEKFKGTDLCLAVEDVPDCDKKMDQKLAKQEKIQDTPTNVDSVLLSTSLQSSVEEKVIENSESSLGTAGNHLSQSAASEESKPDEKPVSSEDDGNSCEKEDTEKNQTHSPASDPLAKENESDSQARVKHKVNSDTDGERTEVSIKRKVWESENETEVSPKKVKIDDCNIGIPSSISDAQCSKSPESLKRKSASDDAETGDQDSNTEKKKPKVETSEQ